MIRLERLGPQHGAAILAGQDRALAEEIIGTAWDAARLADFLARAAAWRADGPIREFAARFCGAGVAEQVIGGGGLNRLAPGLERGDCALTYWVLAPHRGQGFGQAIAAALVSRARSDPQVRRLVVRISPDNTPSRGVAVALGAEPAGVCERHPVDAARVVERWELRL